MQNDSQASGSIRADEPARWFDLAELATLRLARTIEFRRSAGSTNDVALKLAVDATALPLLVLTEQQTGGRGRGTNQWWASEGALTFSVLMDAADLGILRERLPLISLTTAIAVADTLSEFARGSAIGLKWPNDVHLQDRKVCGILVEPVNGRVDRVVIGIGLNVCNSLKDAPVELRELATSLLDETGTQFGVMDVLQRLLCLLESRLRELGESRLEIARRWASQCVLTGKRIRIDAGGTLVTGICRGVAESGGIQIECDGEVRVCFGGVVRVVV